MAFLTIVSQTHTYIDALGLTEVAIAINFEDVVIDGSQITGGVLDLVYDYN